MLAFPSAALTARCSCGALWHHVKREASRFIPSMLRHFDAGALIEIDLRSLALFRIGIALTLLVDLAGRARDASALYGADGVLPPDLARLLWGWSVALSPFTWVAGWPSLMWHRTPCPSGAVSGARPSSARRRARGLGSPGSAPGPQPRALHRWRPLSAAHAHVVHSAADGLAAVAPARGAGRDAGSIVGGHGGAGPDRTGVHGDGAQEGGSRMVRRHGGLVRAQHGGI